MLQQFEMLLLICTLVSSFGILGNAQPIEGSVASRDEFLREVVNSCLLSVAFLQIAEKIVSCHPSSAVEQFVACLELWQAGCSQRLS